MASDYSPHWLRPARSRVRAYLVNRPRSLMQRGVVALKIWSSRDNNPFLERALRIETRKHKPFLTVMGVAIITWLVVVAGWYWWEVWYDNLTISGPFYRPRTRSTIEAFARAMGGNAIGLMATLALAVCAYAAIRASRARAGYLLRQEVLKGTIDQLQLMPILEERWLWMMSAHPTVLALLIGFVGFPMYAVALYTGQWSLLDLLGLGFIFLMLGHVMPIWQPTLWKQQGGKPQRQKFDLKQWQENLKQARGDLDPSVLKPVQMTAAQRLEMQRRTQRAMSGVAEAVPGNSESASQPAPSTESSNNNKSKGQNLLLATSSAGASNFGTVFGWFSAWMVFQGVMTGLRLGGGAPAAFLSSFWNSLPTEITSLLPALPFTWPLLFARLLVTPLPFFSFVLPSIVLILPLWIGISQQRFSSLASSVSSLETFWTPRRMRKRAAIGAAIWMGSFLLCLGYGWQILIVDGTFSFLLRGAPPNTDWALATLWTLALVIGTVRASSALEGPFTRASHGEINLDEARRMALLKVTHTLLATCALYFIFCWLGGVSGISPAWLDRLVPTMGTVAAFLLADFSSALLQNMVQGMARTALRTGRTLWAFGLAGEAVLRIIYGAIYRTPFTFEQAPHVILSPFVTLFSLFRFELSRPTAEWWWGPLAQALVGVVCLTTVALLRLSRNSNEVESVAEEQENQKHWSDVFIAPFRTVIKLIRRLLLGVLQIIERVNQVLRSWNEWIAQRGNRFENAVLTAELRRRAQKEHWSLQLILLFLCEAIMFLLIADPGVLIGLSWQGNTPPTNYGDWAQAVVMGVLVPAWFFTALSMFSIGQSFDRERANSTLLFLFLTPLTDAAILAGKLVPGLFYGAFLLMTALPWLMFGCIIGILAGSSMTAAITVVGALYVLSTWLFAAYINLLFAIYATKPTQGASEAFVVGAGIEIACWALVYYVNMVITNGVRGQDSIVTMSGTLGISVVHCILAFVAWRLALKVLRRQRYGDVLEKRPTIWQVITNKINLSRRQPDAHTSLQ